MKQRFRAITQVSLAVLLALTLGLVTAVPSIAQGSAQESASISPPTEVYDLGDPADVNTTVTWHDAERVVSVVDDGYQLQGGDYSVTAIDADRATLTILNSYLAGNLTAAGDSLALTIEFDSGDPAVFTIVAVRYPAVSPEEADYDLDNPPDFIKTSITWGRASKIERIADDERDLTPGVNNDYIVLLNTLFILTDYLEANLKEDEDKLELAIEFNVGDPARFTIVAFETIPTPNPAAYDLFAPADVEITIKWHTVTEVVSIVDDDGYSLERGPRRDYSVSETTLTIFNSYLEGKLITEGDTLVLTIEFNVGAITFTIKAVDRAPSIAPERADYDLDNPANATTTVTWGDAIEVVSITENNNFLTPEDHYTVGQIINDEKATLTILNDYLSDELTDVDQSVELSIRFGFNSTIHPDLQHYATFNITAIGTHPTISPVVAPYDLRSEAAVNTTITWRGAKSIVSVADDGYQLQKYDDYSETTIDADRATLTILNSYLAGNLTAAGDSLALAIGFDFGDPADFTITAVNETPRINPQRTDYDLGPDPDKRGDVETIITRQVPIQVVSITENGNPLIKGHHYEVEDIAERETATLTIRSDSYLNLKLRDVGDEAVLTIEFSVGDPVTFTIIGVRCPAVDPTEALYDLDDRADFIETRITWGSARKIDRIADHERDLTPSVNNDYKEYIVLGDTLVITDNYLGKLDIGVAVLNIYFDDDYTADFVIRVIGKSAGISPARAVYDLEDRADVQTTITWGSATKVVSITENDAENDNPLKRGHDYVVGQTVDGQATLNITRAYLETKVIRWVDEVLLTVEFDAGKNVTLSIGGLAGCFIATAAYDTAMAQEIQVLREFRDEYLLTNSLGQGLVDVYYTISPPIADFITDHPGLKPIVRAGLMPVVAVCSIVLDMVPQFAGNEA
ncbi:MAG: X2-like carbohydrate binding domain-containing protein [Dehalococcoidia bacterium]